MAVSVICDDVLGNQMNLTMNSLDIINKWILTPPFPYYNAHSNLYFYIQFTFHFQSKLWKDFVKNNSEAATGSVL